MDRKRRLPARAAARNEQAAKKRNVTPRERSETPATSATPQPAEEPSPPQPPPLPTSIQVGKPLPTVETAQPEDLTTQEFQSLLESGVLAESLSRSRHRWLSDGLFERFWAKPHKRKGVLIEDPKNPPKDTMTRVGTVTFNIEPHIVEAIMYVVKDPKARQQQQQPSQPAGSNQAQTPSSRPVIQYGPPNGSMPPPSTAAPATATSAVATPQSRPATSNSQHTASPVLDPKKSYTPPLSQTTSLRPASPAPSNIAKASAISSTGQIGSTNSGNSQPKIQSKPPASQSSPSIAQGPPPAAARPSPSAPARPNAPGPAPPVNKATAKPPLQPAQSSSPAGAKAPHTGPSSSASAPKPPANDPVIALLAQRASSDESLRNLMKKVAIAQANEGELAQFQRIIDQLNAEYKQKSAKQSPPADKLFVDGRTIKYFAGEVKAILEIVLATNPNQRSSELRPPPRSDPLVVLLVKTALEDQRTKDMIKRIADGRPGVTDTTDLKEILDRLHRDAKTTPQAPLPPSQPKQPTSDSTAPNGQVKAQAQSKAAPQANTQALKPKAPPPPPKPDISAVVFDFGSGDRYLFPKYSILEYLPTKSGQQVVASFLIVRKGSVSDYGGDPKLDYYQPVTIRIFSPTGRHLENLARAVAPQDEVRRYMDDVMDNMTRAEYVLLAMRLPREIADPDKNDSHGDVPKRIEEPRRSDIESAAVPPAKRGVLWPTGNEQPLKMQPTAPSAGLLDAEKETEATYQRLINSVTARDIESV